MTIFAPQKALKLITWKQVDFGVKGRSPPCGKARPEPRPPRPSPSTDYEPNESTCVVNFIVRVVNLDVYYTS